ncbi:acetate/propionate family kinase [Agrobacterium sp. V1]|uniref:acetate/propionate family kinase n=1 Tax=Agrobacterium sp. V1 TaxID=3061957 RepID=UPI002671646C|nr:acetate/propionate family kinase [Agrobacterium sp. V1]MDO3445484.1 acetate/propionate family kinase [Agrobacterium sp. V1]
MEADMLLAFNAGSSSLKIGVFEVIGGMAKPIGRARVDLEILPLKLSVRTKNLDREEQIAGDPEGDFSRVIEQVLSHIETILPGNILAVGHRVVHGGMTFGGPVLFDDKVAEKIEELVALAPLHQPVALRVMRAVSGHNAGIRQTASFDTAFHMSQDDLARRLAIPRKLHDAGVRRYGFHGLSYKYIVTRLAEIDRDAANGRVIAAHLGSGASICGMLAGRSCDTSMGFSALDGIPMATRPGWLDPGALLYLMRNGMPKPGQIEHFLYHECGLLGVSGISGDVRVLLKDPNHRAEEAVELFCLRAAGEISRQAATLGGIDALVFTAGIGENQPAIRRCIAERLRWLGLEIDDKANEAHAQEISAKSSRIKAFIIPTDEEQVIADEALSVLSRHSFPRGIS